MAISKIVNEISGANESTISISQGVKGISERMENINDSITGISKMADNSATSAHQAIELSQELNNITTTLTNVVGKFKV